MGESDCLLGVNGLFERVHSERIDDEVNALMVFGCVFSTH